MIGLFVFSPIFGPGLGVFALAAAALPPGQPVGLILAAILMAPAA